MASCSRGLLTLFIFFVLLVSFQNCEVSSLKSNSNDESNSSDINSSITGGNGGGYDGKPGNIFYHFVPSFQCLNQKSQFYSKIILDGNNSVLIDQSNCEKQSTEILINDLQFSLYDHNLVGYKNDLFMYSSSDIAPDQDTYIEAWCFDNSDAKRELVIKYNAQTQVSSGLLYQKNTPVESLEPLSRVITNTKALFKGKNSELLIDKNSKNADLLYQTSLKIITSSNQNLDMAMTCRLGGYLDSTLWPAKNRGQGSEIIFTKDRKFAFQIQNSSNSPSSANQIVKISLENLESTVLTKNSYGNIHIKKIHLSSDEKFLFYLSDQAEQPFVFNLYVLTLKDNSIIRLSQNLQKPENSVSDYIVFPNSPFLFYTDASYFDPITSSYQLTLKKVSVIDDHQIENISEHSTQFTPGQRIVIPNQDLQFLKKTSSLSDSMEERSVLYYFQISENLLMAYDLWKYDIKTSKKQLLYRSTANQMIIISSLIFNHPDSNQLLLTVYNQQYKPQTLSIKDQIASSLRGSSLIAASFNKTTQHWLTLNEYNPVTKLGTISVYDENIVVNKQISFTHTISFNNEAQELYFINDQEKIMSYSFSSKVEKSLCPELNAIKNFTITNNNELYILKYIQNETQVFKMDSMQTCHLINRIPISFDLDGQLVLSPSHNSLILNVSSFLSNAPAESLFWIPLNGLSPMRIDTAETPANWWNGFFDNTSSKIFYFGFDKNFTESSLFQWNLPL